MKMLKLSLLGLFAGLFLFSCTATADVRYVVYGGAESFRGYVSGGSNFEDITSGYYEESVNDKKFWASVNVYWDGPSSRMMTAEIWEGNILRASETVTNPFGEDGELDVSWTIE